MIEAFPHHPNLVYLNHAAVGPWPQCTYAAVERFAKENIQQGAKAYPEWLKTERRLRERLCRLINAESIATIALLKNTSEALSVVAYGLDWQAGDNIVLGDHEFPSNRIVWESLQDLGVETRVVRLDNIAQAEDQLIEATDKRTRLLSSSSVHYASGLRIDLAKLGEHCAENRILFCVDAIQSLGAMPFDAQAIHADFVAADGHKWMLGPEGLALFYCRPEHLESLKLYQYGWHMVKHAGDYDRQDWQAAGNAQRFECGSPNMLGITALESSLAHLQSVGVETISKHITEHVDYLIETLQTISNDISILSPTTPQRRAGILTFRINGLDNRAMHQYLVEHDIICAHRGDGIRFSPHYYHSRAQLDQALNVLKAGIQEVD